MKVIEESRRMPVIKPLSIPQRALLLAHLDAPQPAYVAEIGTRRALTDLGYLFSCQKDGTPRPKPQNVHYTAATESGRHMIASILAEYAEALIRAGCLDPFAAPLTIAPFTVEAVETRRLRGIVIPQLVEQKETIA